MEIRTESSKPWEPSPAGVNIRREKCRWKWIFDKWMVEEKLDICFTVSREF
jgi:hypothetical protein